MKSPNRQLAFPLLEQIQQTIASCERCPRLRTYCKKIGETKRRAYLDHTYWARPVPGLGATPGHVFSSSASLPGAHGANRTGRPFTATGAGNFMYPVLHEVGLASKAEAVSKDDGLKLRHTGSPRSYAVLRRETSRRRRRFATAPPTSQPRSNYYPASVSWSAWERSPSDGYLAYLARTGVIERKSAYTFAHGALYELPTVLHLLTSYHPSLRNTTPGG